MQVEKYAVSCEISYLHLINFNIVCIILSSAHVKSFYLFIFFVYFPLSVPNPTLLNPMDILSFCLKNFFKVSSNSCMDFIF